MDSSAQARSARATGVVSAATGAASASALLPTAAQPNTARTAAGPCALAPVPPPTAAAASKAATGQAPAPQPGGEPRWASTSSATERTEEKEEEEEKPDWRRICLRIVCVIILLLLAFIFWWYLIGITFGWGDATVQTTKGATESSPRTTDEHVATSTEVLDGDMATTTEATNAKKPETEERTSKTAVPDAEEPGTQTTTPSKPRTTKTPGTETRIPVVAETTPKTGRPSTKKPDAETTLSTVASGKTDKFNKAHLSCMIGTRHSTYPLETEVVLKICLRIVAPASISYGRTLLPSFREDDRALRTLYEPRFFWAFDDNARNSWMKQKDLVNRSTVAKDHPTAAGFGVISTNPNAAFSSGFVKEVVQHFKTLHGRKMVLAVTISQVSKETLEKLSPMTLQGIDHIILTRETYGKCLKKGLWYDPSYLDRVGILKRRFPLAVSITTTFGPAAIAQFNTSGHQECAGMTLDTRGIKKCGSAGPVSSDRFSCSGKWYGFETTDSLSEMVEYAVKNHYSCFIQDLELYKAMTAVVQWDFSVLTG